MEIKYYDVFKDPDHQIARQHCELGYMPVPRKGDRIKFDSEQLTYTVLNIIWTVDTDFVRVNVVRDEIG